MLKKTLPNWKRAISASGILRCLPLVLFILTSCAYSRPLSVTYAFEGPPLALYGETAEGVFEGEMERTAMVGTGKISLGNTSTGLVCSGNLETMPSMKGIIRGYMICTDRLYLLFGLRSLGSDQGFGVGYFAVVPENQDETEYDEEGRPKAQKGEQITLFYHPWMDEAKRRIRPIREDLDELGKTESGGNK